MEANRAIAVYPLKAFSDNYIWVIDDGGDSSGNGERGLAVVDPGEAAPVLAMVHAQPGGHPLTDILLTHHHNDHSGGIAELQRHFPEVKVHEGIGEAMLFGRWSLRSWATPGHTLDHRVFLLERAGEGHLFCGDTLFSAGCGRLFEGTAAMMLESLQSLSRLPPHTLIYCAHEYTLKNLAFALAAEPDNQAVRDHLALCQELRAVDRPTLPSTLALERAINPFLRTQSPALRACLGLAEASELAVFSALREWRNRFSASFPSVGGVRRSPLPPRFPIPSRPPFPELQPLYLEGGWFLPPGLAD